MRTCSGRFSWVAANNARVARPPPHLVAVSLETASAVLAVGCHMSLTQDDMVGGEVADAEGSSRVVSVNVEYDALGLAWRQPVVGFWSPWLSLSTALPLAAFAASSYRRDGGL